jgi:hypothetical protein
MLLDEGGDSGDPVLHFEWKRQVKRYVEAVDNPTGLAHLNMKAS